MSLYPLDNNLRQKKIYRVTFLYFFLRFIGPQLKYRSAIWKLQAYGYFFTLKQEWTRCLIRCLLYIWTELVITRTGHLYFLWLNKIQLKLSILSNHTNYFLHKDFEDKQSIPKFVVSFFVVGQVMGNREFDLLSLTDLPYRNEPLNVC